MAHFVLEYSNNIASDTLALQSLFEKLHQAAVDTGMFPLKGIRSRAYACEDYRIADGNPDHIFLHLSVLLGAGRNLREREVAAKMFFNVLCTHFSESINTRGVAISFEMKELEPVLKYNKNTIQEFL